MGVHDLKYVSGVQILDTCINSLEADRRGVHQPPRGSRRGTLSMKNRGKRIHELDPASLLIEIRDRKGHLYPRSAIADFVLVFMFETVEVM